MAYISFQPHDHFNTLLYSGNSSARSLTGVGFEPSWVWIKERTSTSDHMLFDQPRGVQKYISSNLTNAEQTSAGMLTAFDSDGFSLGSGNDVNDNGQTYVAWNWKANGQGSSNTDGSINTAYTSANTTAGISISQYTGTGANATVGHGLGVAPKVVITKCTSNTSNWGVYHKSIGATKMLNLNQTNGEATNNGYFNDTDPTSSVFSLGDEGNDTNGSGKTYIAYCFAEKTGFSKFGSYTGNGNVDGSFIYTGFKPAFFLYKLSSASGQNWTILDNKREPNNVMGKLLHPDLSNAESDQTGGTAVIMDFLSNGIKIRGNDSNINGSGNTYIYMAFAEEPVVASNGTPTTAR